LEYYSGILKMIADSVFLARSFYVNGYPAMLDVWPPLWSPHESSAIHLGRWWGVSFDNTVFLCLSKPNKLSLKGNTGKCWDDKHSSRMRGHILQPGQSGGGGGGGLLQGE